MEVGRLRSGGVITNYYCSSKCAHCLYNSSPSWDRDYMGGEMGERVVKAILGKGCRSVHVGGGEPFLNAEGLISFLKTAQANGLEVEYVETNSSWCKDGPSAASLLRRVREAGVGTLLLSISPYHGEYIPVSKVKGLMGACGEAGMSVFPWSMGFMGEMEALGEDGVHGLDEYERRYGPGYREGLLKRFPLNPRGRAAGLFGHLPERGWEELAAEAGACDEFTSTGHFHVDLYGNYMSNSCVGLSVDVGDLSGPLDRGKYEVLYTLRERGVAGLVGLASDRHGYEPKPRYRGKCYLCFDVRRHLALAGRGGRAVAPLGYYAHD
ncbi:MAG: radical SAM protein [Oscillospiraceae bacterium]|nr:radical SAM protein [Oscillospiraceae bacterium]